MTREEALEIATTMEALPIAERWLDRGDGIAVYRNEDLGHPDLGDVVLVSFGSTAAQLETDIPPRTLPDIGGAIYWRYQLVDTYRAEGTP